MGGRHAHTPEVGTGLQTARISPSGRDWVSDYGSDSRRMTSLRKLIYFIELPLPLPLVFQFTLLLLTSVQVLDLEHEHKDTSLSPFTQSEAAAQSRSAELTEISPLGLNSRTASGNAIATPPWAGADLDEVPPPAGEGVAAADAGGGQAALLGMIRTLSSRIHDGVEVCCALGGGPRGSWGANFSSASRILDPCLRLIPSACHLHTSPVSLLNIILLNIFPP